MSSEKAIRAFRGVLYNQAIVGDLSNVIAPPYDVIDSELYDQLYDRHPRNCVRLILASRDYSYDVPDENYRAIRDTLKFWMSEKALLRDEKPTIYALQQMFEVEGETVKRRGIICELNLSLNEEGRVVPHEKTMKGPIEDRFKMLKYAKANYSPIFLLYSDPENRVNRLLEQHLKGPAEIFSRIDGCVVNRLWRVNDPALVEEVESLIGQIREFYIADGHHRFATAIQFRDYVNREGLDYGDFHLYTLVYLTCMEDEGLRILPIHRIVEGVDKEMFGNAVKCAEDFFKIRRIERAIPSRDRGEFMRQLFLEFHEDMPLFFCFSQEGIWGFFAKEEEKIEEPAVCLLHDIFIKRCIKEPGRGEKIRIRYEKSIDSVFKAVFDSDDRISIILRAITPEQFKKTISSGRKLVEKSTFFYPKLPSGLVMRIG